MAQDGHSIIQTSNAFNPGLSAQDSRDAQCDLAAAMLFRPELLDGYGDLVWAELFTEPIYRDVASLFKLGVRSSEQIQQTIRACGDYSPGLLADEFLGLEDLAITLRHDHLERAVTALRTDDHITYRLSQLPLTDYGNAQRLVVRHGHDLRFAKALGWLVWDGRRWKPDDAGQVQRWVKHTVRRIYHEAAAAEGEKERKAMADWAKTSESAHRIQKIIDLAWSEPGITVTPDRLDADPWRFNVLNGTIDLRTGYLREHRREDLITKLAPVEYDREATCPTFDRFIDETTSGRENVAAYLQQFLGICLTGDISEQVLPVWWGSGSNGKNTLIDPIAAIMGDYAGKAAPELLVAKKWTTHPTEIADLFGKRLVVASETERGQRLRVQFVKEITGDATLKGRYMR